MCDNQNDVVNFEFRTKSYKKDNTGIYKIPL